jgi:adenylate cyclase
MVEGDMEAHSVKRKLTAILAADVKDYSRLMGEDEEATLHTLHAHRQVTDAFIAQYQGRIVNTAGDSILAEFASVVAAVRCAVDIQRALKTHNTALPASRQMEFRIGINLGDVMADGEQIYGDGVNIAARLESLANPGGICISGTVYEQVENKLALQYEDLGEQLVKNIARPVRVYRVQMEKVPPLPVEQASSLPAARMAAPPEGQGELRRVGIAHHSWVIAATIGLLLIGGTVTAIRYFARPTLSPQSSALITQESSALPLPDKPSIVVLPFVNISEDPKQEYFSDGLTEDLTSDLSKISSLFVIARNSAFTYKGKAVKVQEVSQALGVRYVLEGSVRKDEHRVRVTAQLVDAATGYHLWSERYDRTLQSLFALQDELRQKIVLALKVKLTPEEQERFKRAPTNNLEAYEFVLRGWEQLNRYTKAANAQARQMFGKAVELDPTYAAAYAFLSHTYLREWGLQWSQESQGLEQGLTFAQKAVGLNDSLALAHQLLGLAHLWKKQYEQALAEGERAIVLDPNNADGYTNLAQIRSFVGQPEEAIELVEKAMRLSPHYPASYLYSLGVAYYLAGRYEEAVAALKGAIIRNADLQPAHLILAATYSEWGRGEEAQAEVMAVMKINPAFSLETNKRRLPFKDVAELERYLAALRKAGLK